MLRHRGGGRLSERPVRPDREVAHSILGALDALLATGDLSTGDVPLALLYWTVQGVRFLDRWSVRRRLVPPSPSPTWQLPHNPQRGGALGEAAFLQFQEQIDALLSSGPGQSALAAATARSHFRYLPAAGFRRLPAAASAVSRPPPFSRRSRTATPSSSTAKRWATCSPRRTAYPPGDPADGELLWMYRPWQNAKAIDDGIAVQPYVVFANGQMPPMPCPRLDVARWTTPISPNYRSAGPLAPARRRSWQPHSPL